MNGPGRLSYLTFLCTRGAKWRSAWHARPRHLLGAAPTRGTLMHDKTSFTVCDAVPEIETTPAAGKQKEKKRKKERFYLQYRFWFFGGGIYDSTPTFLFKINVET